MIPDRVLEKIAEQRPGLLSRREARLATLVAALIIGALALVPGSGAPTLIGWDKLDHLSAFAALTLLARAGWPGAHRLVTAGALFIYGIAIEGTQSLSFIGRTPSVSDLVANAVGIALGLLLAVWLGRIARTLSWLPRRG